MGVGRSWSRTGAPDRRGGGTQGLTAELLRAPGAAQPHPGSARERGSGTCGEPASGCGQDGLSGRAQVRDPTPKTRRAKQELGQGTPPLPLHVGVPQRLRCAKPLARGKYQESLEEIQGLRGGVWRQEGVQRLPWPVGACILFPFQGGPLPVLRPATLTASVHLPSPHDTPRQHGTDGRPLPASSSGPLLSMPRAVQFPPACPCPQAKPGGAGNSNSLGLGLPSEGQGPGLGGQTGQQIYRRSASQAPQQPRSPGPQAGQD